MTELQRLARCLADDYQFECQGGPLRNCTEWRALCAAIDTLAVHPPSGASPQAETHKPCICRHSEANHDNLLGCGHRDSDGFSCPCEHVHVQPAPVSPVEPEPPEELPCYCDIPSHILDLGCPRHQAPQCEPEPPKTWSLEIINRTGFTVEPEPCVWREDEDGIWETSCGASWVFIDGSPSENNTKFCHNCGHPVQPVAYVERFDDDEDEAGAPLKVER